MSKTVDNRISELGEDEIEKIASIQSSWAKLNITNPEVLQAHMDLLNSLGNNKEKLKLVSVENMLETFDSLLSAGVKDSTRLRRILAGDNVSVNHLLQDILIILHEKMLEAGQNSYEKILPTVHVVLGVLKRAAGDHEHKIGKFTFKVPDSVLTAAVSTMNNLPLFLVLRNATDDNNTIFGNDKTFQVNVTKPDYTAILNEPKQEYQGI